MEVSVDNPHSLTDRSFTGETEVKALGGQYNMRTTQNTYVTLPSAGLFWSYKMYQKTGTVTVLSVPEIRFLGAIQRCSALGKSLGRVSLSSLAPQWAYAADIRVEATATRVKRRIMQNVEEWGHTRRKRSDVLSASQGSSQEVTYILGHESTIGTKGVRIEPVD